MWIVTWFGGIAGLRARRDERPGRDRWVAGIMRPIYPPGIGTCPTLDWTGPKGGNRNTSTGCNRTFCGSEPTPLGIRMITGNRGSCPNIRNIPRLSPQMANFLARPVSRFARRACLNIRRTATGCNRISGCSRWIGRSETIAGRIQTPGFPPFRRFYRHISSPMCRSYAPCSGPPLTTASYTHSRVVTFRICP